MSIQLWGTTHRVCLLFVTTHSVLYKRVSLNILREVGSYYCGSLLPAVNLYGGAKAILYNLLSGTHTVVPLSATLPAELMYCRISESALFCVGGGDLRRQAWRADLRSGAVTHELPMREDRCWPGLICVQSRVFVFGGEALKSCEVFSLTARQWSECPAMLKQRQMFTPVEHRGEIYLPGFQLEVFNPAMLQHRLLSLCLQEACPISFVCGEHLFLLVYSRKVLAWTIDSHETQARTVIEFM